MDNLELLRRAPNTLTPNQQHSQAVLVLALTPNPCPNCGRRVTAPEAMGLPVHRFSLRDSTADARLRCPGCQAPLYALPLSDDSWEWQMDLARLKREKRQGSDLDADAREPAQAPRYVHRRADRIPGESPEEQGD